VKPCDRALIAYVPGILLEGLRENMTNSAESENGRVTIRSQVCSVYISRSLLITFPTPQGRGGTWGVVVVKALRY